MLDVFRGLKNLIKVNYVHIDSPVFRLHYSITVILLISFSLIVTTRQYVGNPIDCIHTKDIPEDVLNTYCWIHSTYTLKSFFNKKVGVEVPYPGIGNSREKGKEDMSDRKIYKYYQWVCFCLFFQVSLRFILLNLYNQLKLNFTTLPKNLKPMKNVYYYVCPLKGLTIYYFKFVHRNKQIKIQSMFLL